MKEEEVGRWFLEGVCVCCYLHETQGASNSPQCWCPGQGLKHHHIRFIGHSILIIKGQEEASVVIGVTVLS